MIPIEAWYRGEMEANERWESQNVAGWELPLVS